MNDRTALVIRRAGGSLAAIVFLLLVVAGWRHPDVTWTLRVVGGTLLAVTAVNVGVGAMIVAALLPLAPALHSRLAGDTITELPLLLAAPFLAAGLARIAWARSRPAARLLYPAGLLMAVIAAGVLVDLRPVAPDGWLSLGFARRLSEHLGRDYFVDAGSFQPLHAGLSWIAALALAVVIERVLAADASARAPVVRLALISAAGLALFSANRVAELVLRSVDPIAGLRYVLTELRLNPFYRDINAAGSLYALFAVPALWRARIVGAYGFWLVAALLLLALWLTGSRAALLAAVAGMGIALLAHRPGVRRLALAVAAALLLFLAIGVMRERTGQATASYALDVRLDLLGLGLRIAAVDPVFGVGLDQFRRYSARMASDDLITRFPEARAGENAHNNFVQILAELGPIGLGAFVWALALPLWAAFRPAAAGRDLQTSGLAGGVAAFAISCLAGHPLLIDHIRWCFFLVLGLTAGVTAAAAARPDGEPAPRWPGRLVMAAIVFLLFSLPWRH